MPKGVAKKIDRGMLLIWVEAEDRHRTAMMMQAGLDSSASLKLLIRTSVGLMPSPYNDILDKTAKLMLRACQELGFSPAARPRIHATPEPCAAVGVGGPEGSGGDPSSLAVWSGALAACIGAPIAGFILRAHRRIDVGLAIALIPPLVARCS
jgi:hypothetical protein